MYEHTEFPTAHCSRCARRVLVGRELTEDDAWRAVCARCDAQLGHWEQVEVEEVGVQSLEALGFEVEGEGKLAGGCGVSYDDDSQGGCGGSCGVPRA